MEINYNKIFLKDLQHQHDKALAKKLERVFQQIKDADNISQIAGLKKLKGIENYYRLRTGDYRIGLYIKEDYIELQRFLHRKKIYNYYPKKRIN